MITEKKMESRIDSTQSQMLLERTMLGLELYLSQPNQPNQSHELFIKIVNTVDAVIGLCRDVTNISNLVNDILQYNAIQNEDVKREVFQLLPKLFKNCYANLSPSIPMLFQFILQEMQLQRRIFINCVDCYTKVVKIVNKTGLNNYNQSMLNVVPVLLSTVTNQGQLNSARWCLDTLAKCYAAELEPIFTIFVRNCFGAADWMTKSIGLEVFDLVMQNLGVGFINRNIQHLLQLVSTNTGGLDGSKLASVVGRCFHLLGISRQGDCYENCTTCAEPNVSSSSETSSE